MKIVFMGTPDFASTILEALIDAGHEITAVYTQPDKPQGRSSELIASPVKKCALAHNIAVYQPEKIKAPEEVERLKTIPADIFVVAAFGQFLSEEILNIPKFNCVNVHGSLLPKLRGAAPIQRCIVNEDDVTGVTVMRMAKGMDSGDMISKVEVKIADDETEESLYEKLAVAGAKLIVDTLPSIENGTAVYTVQDESLVTFAPSIKKEEGKLDFNKTSHAISCQVRGFHLWPGTFTYKEGKLLKVYGVSILCADSEEYRNISAVATDFTPGSVVVTKKDVYVKTADGFVKLIEVQPEGKKRMPAIDYARGARLQTGESFD